MELIERITDNIYQINLGYVKSFVIKTKNGDLILVDTGMPGSAIKRGLPYLTKVRYPVGHDVKSIAFSMMIRLMAIRVKLKPVKVDMLLKEGVVPESFGINMKILETPGHTDDSVSFYLPDEKVVIVGDLLMGIKELGSDVTVAVSHGINGQVSKIKI